MINKFTEKGIVQKIIVVLIFLVVFNFVYPYVPAFAAGGDLLESIGGVLINPLINLITSIGEGIIWIIQDMVLGLPASNIHIKKDGVLETLTAILAGVAAGAALVFAPISFGASTVIFTAVAVGLITKDNLSDDWFFPVYKISPQEIFADQIPALHINFINPKTYDEEGEGTQNKNSDTPQYTENEKTLGVIDSAKVFNSAKVLSPQISLSLIHI